MTDAVPQDSTSLLETLQDWQDAGGHWQVIARSETRVTVALLRCDGGEEVDRLSSADSGALAFLKGRNNSMT